MRRRLLRSLPPPRPFRRDGLDDILSLKTRHDQLLRLQGLCQRQRRRRRRRPSNEAQEGKKAFMCRAVILQPAARHLLYRHMYDIYDIAYADSR